MWISGSDATNCIIRSRKNLKSEKVHGTPHWNMQKHNYPKVPGSHHFKQRQIIIIYRVVPEKSRANFFAIPDDHLVSL